MLRRGEQSFFIKRDILDLKAKPVSSSKSGVVSLLTIAGALLVVSARACVIPQQHPETACLRSL